MQPKGFARARHLLYTELYSRPQETHCAHSGLSHQQTKEQRVCLSPTKLYPCQDSSRKHVSYSFREGMTFWYRVTVLPYKGFLNACWIPSGVNAPGLFQVLLHSARLRHGGARIKQTQLRVLGHSWAVSRSPFSSCNPDLPAPPQCSQRLLTVAPGRYAGMQQAQAQAQLLSLPAVPRTTQTELS